MEKLTCNIYKPSHGDSSNGGLSSKYDTCLLVWNVKAGEDLSELPENTVLLITEKDNGKRTPRCEPIAYLKKYICLINKDWFMFGGCFVYTSDSRRPIETALPLFDKVRRPIKTALPLFDRTEK